MLSVPTRTDAAPVTRRHWQAAPLLAAMLLFPPASTAAAPDTSATQRPFTGDDLFHLQVASDPQISPDGSRVAYVRGRNDIMVDRMRSAIWLVDVASGRQTALTDGAFDATEPRWSPDGQSIAYVAKTADGTHQIFLARPGAGPAARISTLTARPRAISWSPDGSRIAFVMAVAEEPPRLGSAPSKPAGATWAPPLEITMAVTYRRDGSGYVKPGHDHIFVLPATGGAARQLSSGPFDDGGPLSWTPDGRTLLFSANRTPGWERQPLNSEVYALDVDSLDLRQITDRDGPDNNPVASPDGRHIAYLGFDDRRMGYQNLLLYVADRDGGHRHVLTQGLDRRARNPVWARDGRSIYIQYDDHGSTRVAQVGLDGHIRDVAEGLIISDLDRPYGGGGTFSVARDGTVAYTSGTPLRPADIAVTRGGKAKRLTRLNDDWLAGRMLGQVRSFTATAPDGQPIQAWMITPPGFDPARKYPMILEIHGGPFASYGPTFAVDHQLYAAAGYVVVYSNPRGSTSYGEAFANLIHHAYPGKDHDDLMAVVDAAIAMGSIDPDQLFITGGSGGGLLTAWTIGKTDRFKAAAVQKPVINWSSFMLTTDIGSLIADNWFGTYPWDDPQAYWKRSPLSLVGHVRTPALVLVGTDDYRTVAAEAEQYYAALQQRGIATALIKVPEASHDGVASRPSQLAAKSSAILAWFARYRSATPTR